MGYVADSMGPTYDRAAIVRDGKNRHNEKQHNAFAPSFHVIIINHRKTKIEKKKI